MPVEFLSDEEASAYGAYRGLPSQSDLEKLFFLDDDIYAETSTRWRDPRAQLLDGEAWTAAKDTVLTALGLPEDPDALLAAHARLLDDTYRGVAGRFTVNDAVSVDADGRLHVERIKAIPEPGSLTGLRKRVGGMLPLVDLPEVLLEVMGWDPAFAGAFTSVSGSRSRLADLDITIAACLTAHALNIGWHGTTSPQLASQPRLPECR